MLFCKHISPDDSIMCYLSLIKLLAGAWEVSHNTYLELIITYETLGPFHKWFMSS